MKKAKQYWVYIASAVVGAFACLIALVYGSSVSDVLLAIGSGIVTSTIVSFLVNMNAERKISKQKQETRDVLLQQMLTQAENVLFKLLVKVNEFYEKIHPDSIVFPDGKGEFCLACINCHDKSDLREEKMAFPMEQINTAYFPFWRFDLSLEEQNINTQDQFRRLFCRDNDFITDFISGLGSINSDTLFAMGLITKEEKDLLPSYSEITILRSFDPPPKSLEELDVANTQLMIDKLCTFCLHTCEGIWKIYNSGRFFRKEEYFKETNEKCARFLEEELYGWHDTDPPGMIIRNIKSY